MCRLDLGKMEVYFFREALPKAYCRFPLCRLTAEGFPRPVLPYKVVVVHREGRSMNPQG